MVGDVSYARTLLEGTRQQDEPASAESASASASPPTPPSRPPSLDRRRPPHSFIPLPVQLPGVDYIEIHPVLKHPLDASIAYDLSQVPPTPSQEAEVRTYREPATDPPLPSLAFLIDDIGLVAIVHASIMVGSLAAVTVEDVLTTLHRQLHQPMTREDTHFAMPFNRQGWSHGLELRENSSRRIDFLGERRLFLGLSNNDGQSDIMTVHIG